MIRLPDAVWVVGQFALGALLLAAPEGGSWLPGWTGWGIRGVAILSVLAIIVVAGARLGRALTPNPTPVPDATLSTSGVYAWVRHPMYAVVIAGAWLYAVPSDRAWKPLAALALHLWMSAKCRHEERLLTERYPEYLEYRRRVPAFVPRRPRR